MQNVELNELNLPSKWLNPLTKGALSSPMSESKHQHSCYQARLNSLQRSRHPRRALLQRVEARPRYIAEQVTLLQLVISPLQRSSCLHRKCS